MDYINTYPLRHVPLNRFRHGLVQRPPFTRDYQSHDKRVLDELKQARLSRFGLKSMEGHHIAQIIHPDEHISGAIYGYCKDGYAMVVATDSRVIYLDNKPLFSNKDEITYGLVGGISCGKVGPLATVTLHTKLGDYKLKTASYRSVGQFVNFIEQRCLEHKLRSEMYADDFSTP